MYLLPEAISGSTAAASRWLIIIIDIISAHHVFAHWMFRGEKIVPTQPAVEIRCSDITFKLRSAFGNAGCKRD